jgi:hypothetical protein
VIDLTGGTTLHRNQLYHPETVPIYGDYRRLLHSSRWRLGSCQSQCGDAHKVYGQVTTIVGIVSGLVTTFGTGKMFSVRSNGETRSPDIDEMKDTAETVMRSLEIMTDLDDPRNEIENLGPTIVRLHEDVILLTQHLALNSQQTTQASSEELAGAGN